MSPTERHQPSDPRTVDVIIPVYNGQDFILEAIQSVEQQTHVPQAIIVVDDGSTDRTGEIVQGHVGRVPITYIKKPNGGLSSARNAGIRAISSQYVGFLDADDAWESSKLAKQLDVFARAPRPNLGVVYCGYTLIDAAGNPARGFFHVAIDKNIRGWVFEHILPVNKVVSSASGALVTRECFTQAGGFDEHLAAAEDWDMWLRIAQTHEFDFVDEPLVKIRRHGSNMQNDAPRMFKNRMVFYDKWLTSLPAITPIPPIWAKVIIAQVLGRFPRRDFWIILKQVLSAPAKRRLRQVVMSQVKLYMVARILLLPFSILKHVIQPSSEVM